jgi:hypothetical protein
LLKGATKDKIPRSIHHHVKSASRVNRNPIIEMS